MTTFKTDVKLGERYRDKSTGFEGTAESVHFYRHGCERIVLKGMNNQGEIVDYSFDAPELEHAETGRVMKPMLKRPGGPGDTPARRSALPRR